MQKIPVGISSCVLGEEVRYNGGHKHSRYCTGDLSAYFEYHPYCPEVAIGLGVPREPIRLVGDFNAPRVVGTKDENIDVTEPLIDYAETVAEQSRNLCGYIFMKDSPSCGLYSTKVYTEKGVHPGKRAGVFAHRMVERLPLLPMEESGRLNDAVLRENFIARVFLYHQWQQLSAAGITPGALVAFHSRQKYLTMAYSQALYKRLGQIVARAGVGSIEDTANEYIHELMAGTRKAPSRKGHTNVLYHLLGYLKERVPGGIRQDLTVAIEEYRTGVVPLAVPMKLMAHYIEHYADDYVQSQSYLNPYPFELGLRNTI